MTFVTIEICEIFVIIAIIGIRETITPLEVGTQEIDIEAVNTIAIFRATTGMTRGTTTENNGTTRMIQETKNINKFCYIKNLSKI